MKLECVLVNGSLVMSNKSEEEFAKHIGAKPVKNSGRGIKKSDMVKGNYIIDLKESKKSFTLNPKVWSKVQHDAMTYGWDKVPVMVVKFSSGPTLVVMDIGDTEISA